jgi:Zn finger protein HypA/HybF involved in hydrogenase expression
MKINGRAAFKAAEIRGTLLNKYADPIAGAREGLSLDEARQIGREDPGMIWCEFTCPDCGSPAIVQGGNEEHEEWEAYCTQCDRYDWDYSQEQAVGYFLRR